MKAITDGGFWSIPHTEGIGLINCIFLLFLLQYTKWRFKETENRPIYIKMHVCHPFPLGEAITEEAESLTHSVGKAKERKTKRV